MRAVVMTRKGGPEVLEVREMPWPEPAVGELLVRVLATSVNPIDLKLRAGRARVDLEPPAVLGYDVSGVVEETGHGVRDFRPGDDVGSIAVQIARAAGARVLTTCRPQNADFCRELGAGHVIDHTSEDVPEAVLAETDGEGVDLTLDTVGGDTVARSLRATRMGGRLVSIVTTTGDLAPAYLRNQTLDFIFLRRCRATLQSLARLADRGQLRPVVDSVLPLEEAADGHRQLEQGGVRGKIVLVP